jgi:hypothetical protein
MQKGDMLNVFFVSMLLLSVLTINVSTGEVATTKVSVQPLSQTVGQENVMLPTSPFTINITAEDVEDLYGWQIVLYYNSTILSTRQDLVIIPPENLFKGRDFSPIGPYLEYDSKGNYTIFGATLKGDAPGVTGSGVLCQINFTGQATGTSGLNLGIHAQHVAQGGYLVEFYTSLLNSTVDEIPISIVDGEVTIVGIENPRAPSAITINVNPPTVTTGSNVTITGTINPTRAGVNVTIYIKPAVGAVGMLATVQTDESGSYEYNWTTDEGGEYELYAYWPGDTDYREATSDFATVTVEKWSSTISLNVYPTDVPVGSSVVMNGTITTKEPTLPYENVAIYCEREGGNRTTLATVAPGEDGVYTYTWKTNEGGSYRLQASWPGDTHSESADSIEQTVRVTTGDLMTYLFYIIAAIAIATIGIGIYFTKIRKRQHATEK